MKNYLNIILLLLIGFMFQGCTEKLPKVLIIGDSIAGGYFPFVEEKLNGKVLGTYDLYYSKCNRLSIELQI